jgi:CheY-like chemotaxis protein
MPLAAQGFTIYEAADGSAAWQLAVQNRPWMILADISMPEVDGFEFCRRVRNHPLLSRMPLLFISGSDKYKEPTTSSRRTCRSASCSCASSCS